MLDRPRRGYDGYADLRQAIGKNYAAGSFEEHPRAPDQNNFAFIERARKASGNEQVGTR